MRFTIASTLALALLATAPALADSTVEDEVRAAVEDYYSHLRQHLTAPADAESTAGSQQFWSSGGLVVSVEPDAPSAEYEHFNVHPKHISVLRLSDESAAAVYYAEGSMKPKGSAAVDHYLTRVLSVYVLEDGKWRIRAGHWSPLRGGGGTSRATD